jgi:hypothetical protein
MDKHFQQAFFLMLSILRAAPELFLYLKPVAETLAQQRHMSNRSAQSASLRILASWRETGHINR